MQRHRLKAATQGRVADRVPAPLVSLASCAERQRSPGVIAAGAMDAMGDPMMRDWIQLRRWILELRDEVSRLLKGRKRFFDATGGELGFRQLLRRDDRVEWAMDAAIIRSGGEE